MPNQKNNKNVKKHNNNSQNTNFFRKFLVRIQKEYHQNPRRLYLYSSIIVFGLVVISVLIDSFVPFGGWFTIIRSVLLVPLSISIFILGYSVAIFLHYSQMNQNPNWQAYRLRMSVRWRRRLAIVIGALLLVLVYGAGYSIFYTVFSSVFVACIIALCAFIRTTREERNLEEFNLPDSRDIKQDALIKKRQEARLKAETEKRERRKNNMRKVIFNEKDDG